MVLKGVDVPFSHEYHSFHWQWSLPKRVDLPLMTPTKLDQVSIGESDVGSASRQ